MLRWIRDRFSLARRERSAAERAAPAALRASHSDPELSDEDLQDVVGGLERMYLDRPLAESS